MRHRNSTILTILFAVVLLPGACDKGDEGGTTGAQQEQEPRRERRPPPPPQVEPVCDGVCYTPLPQVGTWQRVAVHTVHYSDPDYIILRNVKQTPTDISGWTVTNGVATATLPEGYTMAPFALLKIHLGEEGTNDADDIYLPDEGFHIGPVGQFALFEGDDLTSAENIRVYLPWGQVPADDSLIRVADEANLWRLERYVPICEGMAGFIAVTDVATPRGYRNQPENCFNR